MISRDLLLDKIIELIRNETDIENITQDSNLFDDLEMSSLEIYSVFAELEIAFDIKLSEKMIGEITSVGDIVNVVSKAIDKSRK